MIDLHIHSTYSDGTNSPLEILQIAEDINLTQIAITDHNCINGALEALKYIDNYSFDFIIGCELTCMYKNKEVHLLGYFNKDNKNFDKLHSFTKTSEENKVFAQQKMIERLQANGFKITLEEINERFKNTVINRVHIARILHEKGYVTSVNEAFDKYIGETKLCYVQRKCPELKDAANTIHSCNGIAVLAHPYQYTKTKIEDFLYDSLKIIDGIEAIHSSHNEIQVANLIKFAENNTKIITGGSDFHGTVKPNIKLGACAVPDKYKLKLNFNNN